MLIYVLFGSKSIEKIMEPDDEKLFPYLMCTGISIMQNTMLIGDENEDLGGKILRGKNEKGEWKKGAKVLKIESFCFIKFLRGGLYSPLPPSAVWGKKESQGCGWGI